MYTVQSFVSTDRASKYLQQLCKHWSHRLDVNFDAHRGSVRFDRVVRDQCVAAFNATDEGLEINLSAGTHAALGMVTKAIEDHLRRFAFREQLTIAWTEVESDS